MFASLALASCQLILVTDKPSCSLDETSNFFLLILEISKDAKLQVHPDEVQTSPRLSIKFQAGSHSNGGVSTASMW